MVQHRWVALHPLLRDRRNQNKKHLYGFVVVTDDTNQVKARYRAAAPRSLEVLPFLPRLALPARPPAPLDVEGPAVGGLPRSRSLSFIIAAAIGGMLAAMLSEDVGGERCH